MVLDDDDSSDAGAPPAAALSADGEVAVDGSDDRRAVSLMITRLQKERLRALGISDEDIRKMKPAEAHARLGL